MVGIGQMIQVQEELYEVQQTIKVDPYKVLPSDLSDEIKKYYRVDKIFKKDNLLYLVNDITVVEPVYD
jgi:cell division protein FtsL